MEKAELKEALTATLKESDEAAASIAERVLACAQALRTNPGPETLNLVASAAEDLGSLAELVRNMRVSSLGLGLASGDPFSAWDTSVVHFSDMVAAFGRQDWGALADLLQYEIHPLLLDTRKGLGSMRDALK